MPVIAGDASLLYRWGWAAISRVEAVEPPVRRENRQTRVGATAPMGRAWFAEEAKSATTSQERSGGFRVSAHILARVRRIHVDNRASPTADAQIGSRLLAARSAMTCKPAGPRTRSAAIAGRTEAPATALRAAAVDEIQNSRPHGAETVAALLEILQADGAGLDGACSCSGCGFGSRRACSQLLATGAACLAS